MLCSMERERVRVAAMGTLFSAAYGLIHACTQLSHSIPRRVYENANKEHGVHCLSGGRQSFRAAESYLARVRCSLIDAESVFLWESRLERVSRTIRHGFLA
jgi:hypothetical protein